MSTEYIRYGADHIVGYVDDDKTLEITPSCMKIPVVRVSTDSSFPAPTAGKNAATKAYVDTAIAAATMGQMPDTLSIAKLDVGLLKVTGQCAVPTPVQSTDATTKAYVDSSIATAVANVPGGTPTLPIASQTVAGIITTTEQWLAGDKTLAGTFTAANVLVAADLTVGSDTSIGGKVVVADERNASYENGGYDASLVTFGGIAAAGYSILNDVEVKSGIIVPTPTADFHAATKAYVDSVAVPSFPTATTHVTCPTTIIKDGYRQNIVLSFMKITPYLGVMSWSEVIGTVEAPGNIMVKTLDIVPEEFAPKKEVHGSCMIATANAYQHAWVKIQHVTGDASGETNPRSVVWWLNVEPSGQTGILASSLIYYIDKKDL